MNQERESKLIWPKATKPDLVTNENDLNQNSLDESHSARDTFTDHQASPAANPSKSLYHDIEARDKFYASAKHEIQGNHLPETQESRFYEGCRQRGLLPLPVFKCINENTMSLQGKRAPLGLGYAKAMATMIVNNQEPSNHLL